MALSANGLTTQIVQILGNLSRAERTELNRSSGYAFEAWVMTMLGAQLERRGWRWEHPAAGPAFAKGNGGTFAHRLQQCSHLAYNGFGCPVLVQGVSVEGASGVMHDLDLALWCGGHSGSPQHFSLGVTAVIEVKNHVSAQSLSCARNLLGLRLDLERQDHHRLETILISAGAVTPNAGLVMSYWGIHHQQKVTAASLAWAADVTRTLRHARGCSWHWHW